MPVESQARRTIYSDHVKKVVAPGIVALGVALTTATQLRFGELPIGPGEILIVAWLVIALTKPFIQAGRIRLPGPLFREFFGFWAISWVLLFAGTAVSATKGHLFLGDTLRDGLAFALVTVFALVLAAETVSWRELHKIMAFVVLISAVSLLVLIVFALATPSVGPVTFWFGKRFVGWAENPNQLALLLAPIPFLSFYLAGIAKSRLEKAFWQVIALMFLPIGLAVGSDALLLAWLAGAGVSAGLTAYRLVRATGRSAAEIMFARTIIAGLGVTIIVVVTIALVTTIRGFAENLATEQGQGLTRFILWLNAVNAIADSPVVGFGPGKYSGLLGPFNHKEAHNSFLDWGMSTGVVGIVLLILCFCRVVVASWRSSQAALLGATLSILVFVQFHYALRHPLLWFWLLLILGVSQGWRVASVNDGFERDG